MLPRLAAIACLLQPPLATLPLSPHLRRDLGMDDGQASIGRSRGGLLWPLPRA